MGLILSKAISFYGFQGWCLDQDGDFVGFISTGGQMILFDGLEDQPNGANTPHYATHTSFITGLVITGPVNSMSKGTITITDSLGGTFVIPANIKLPNGFNPANGSQYTMSYNQTNDALVLGEVGIGSDYNGGTIFTNLGNVPQPTACTMNMDNAGAVGYIEDPEQGLVGFVTDGGNWRLFGDLPNADASKLKAKLFPLNYILSGVDIERCVDKETLFGRAKIRLTAINANGVTQNYDTWQANILPVTAHMTTTTSTSTGTTTTTTPILVIKNLQYYTVPGAFTDRLDYLLTAEVFESYTTPQAASYTQSTVGDNDTIVSVDHGHHNWSTTLLWVFVIVLFIVVLVWGVMQYRNKLAASSTTTTTDDINSSIDNNDSSL